MESYRNKLRAFNVTTKNGVYGNDLYVIIAHDYSEAEDIYWTELHGYYEIISIHEIEGTENVGYRIYND